MNKYLVEFIGTFFLVATIGFAVIAPGADHMAPLAIGAVLMVMIYAGGHISGAHYNPAVTLAVTMRGKCSIVDAPMYMIAQVLGAGVAALVVSFVKGPEAMAAIKGLEVDMTKAMVVEFLYTFALAWVVLHTATAKGTNGNSFYGLAIGFTVLTGAYAVGAISGGAFNPAVAIGASVMGLLKWANIWIYLIADFLGAAVAAALFLMVNPAEVPEQPQLESSRMKAATR